LEEITEPDYTGVAEEKKSGIGSRL
jgi:hypothetical protein